VAQTRLAKAAGITVEEVTAERWPDLVALFESKGGPSYCWCMAWRATSDEPGHDEHERRKRMLHRRVVDGVPIGLLAYRDGVPVAWCSVAPRSTFTGLHGAEHDVDEERVWSIVCFSVQRAARRGGVATALLDAAVRHARAHGAKVVEGYPVDPDSPSYRFMGFRSWFERAGFHEVGRAGTRRHIAVRNVR
jgi:GNAT superfamily N-acetyltransferase